jgi:hypothetical protein
MIRIPGNGQSDLSAKKGYQLFSLFELAWRRQTQVGQNNRGYPFYLLENFSVKAAARLAAYCSLAESIAKTASCLDLNCGKSDKRLDLKNTCIYSNI